tara:strand:+ start:238 stop:1239 length:1002 start_codon:yes stop_codon:yes gene_type:complete
MATVAHAFSPKEFKCFVISDATNAGSTGIHSSNMQQLDVDSISFPSLNVSQVLDIRSGVGHTLKDEDFFQDNKMRVIELSLAGTLHDDVAHRLLLANICGAAEADDTNQTIASGHKIVAQKYGAAVTNNASSLTVVLQPSDVSNQTGLELFGCVVTNFAISADIGTEGGRYKWSATLQTGKVPDLASTAAAGSTVYANTTGTTLASASGIKVFNTDASINNFTCTIDYPAVFTGITSTGYDVVGRGAECSVTVDTQVKYDGNTKGLVNTYDTQTAALAGNTFVVVNNGAFGIEIDNGVLTNVAYSEGDIMMLDCSIKAVDDGTDELLIVDLSN